MPTLRFTGAYSGLDGIWLPKYGGAIARGAEIEVPAEVAERWLVEPSDFALVGDTDAIWASVDYPSEPEIEPEPGATAESSPVSRRRRRSADTTGEVGEA
jgi:hypothetical protein